MSTVRGLSIHKRGNHQGGARRFLKRTLCSSLVSFVLLLGALCAFVVYDLFGKKSSGGKEECSTAPVGQVLTQCPQSMQALLRGMRGTTPGFACTNKPSGQMCTHIPQRSQIALLIPILGTAAYPCALRYCQPPRVAPSACARSSVLPTRRLSVVSVIVFVAFFTPRC